MKTFLSLLLLMMALSVSAAEADKSADKSDQSEDSKAPQPDSDGEAESKSTVLSDARRFTPLRRSAETARNNLWAWPVTESGHFCYTAGKSPVLSRQAGELAYLTIQADDGAQARLRWPAAEADLAWPDARLPLADGRGFNLMLGDHFALLTLHRIPDTIERGSDKAVWMAQQGCVEQARKLFEADDPEALFK